MFCTELSFALQVLVARVPVAGAQFAGLDRVATRRLGETLRELAARKIVIVIAHDFEDIDEALVFTDDLRGRAAAPGVEVLLVAGGVLFDQGGEKTKRHRPNR